MNERDLLCYLYGYLTARTNSDEDLIMRPDEHNYMKELIKVVVTGKGEADE